MPAAAAATAPAPVAHASPVAHQPAPEPIALPALPHRIWEASQRATAANDAVMYAPLGFFSNDYLAYCKLMGLRPHPQLLPQLPAVVPPKADLPSSRLVSRRAAARPGSSSPHEPQLALDEEEPRLFDLRARETLTVRGMLLGPADLSATLPALKHASHVTALVLSRAGLSAASIIALALALPSTTVRELVLEGNALEEEGADASFRSRVPLPPGCAPLPAEIYPTPPYAAKSGGGTEAPAAEDVAGAGSRRRSSVAMPGGTATVYYLPGPSRARAWSLLASRLQRLKRLSLRGNGLGHAEAAAIGDALALNRELESLCLSMNPGVGDEGAAALAAGLRENRGRLTFLGMAGTGVGEAGVAALSSALGLGGAADGPALVARAAWEARLVGELVTDIDALGFREQQLAGVRAEAEAAAAAAAAAPPVAASAGKGAAPAKGGKAAPAGKGKEEPAAPAAEAPHPDAEFFAAFRLPSVHVAAHGEGGVEGGESWSGTLPTNGSLRELDLCGNPGISVAALSVLAAALTAAKAVPPPGGSALAVLSCVGCGCGKGKAASPAPASVVQAQEAAAVDEPAAQDFTAAALAVVDPAVTRAKGEAASAVGGLTDALRTVGVTLFT